MKFDAFKFQTDDLFERLEKYAQPDVNARISLVLDKPGTFSALSWVPVGEEIARTASELAQRHRRAHSGIDDADYLIAATAILLEADLLTTNVRHFPMLVGLAPAY